MSLLERLRQAFPKRRGPASKDSGAPRVPDDLSRRVADAMVAQMLREREAGAPNGLYEATVVSLVFNGERIEGGAPGKEQTQAVFEARRAVLTDPGAPTDARQAANHMQMFDYMLDTLGEPLSEQIIRGLHRNLMDGLVETAGEWKTLRSCVAGIRTADPRDVPEAIAALVGSYLQHLPTLDNIARLHARYETIHPFTDGNGRTGRAVVFRECLRAGLVPPVVTDATKGRYYRALDAFRSGDADQLRDYFEDMRLGYLAMAAPYLADDDLYRELSAFLGRPTEAVEVGFTGPRVEPPAA